MSSRSRLLGKQPVTGVVDVGTSKVVCLIWQAADRTTERVASAGPRLVGFGLQRSAGITAGLVSDALAAEGAIRRAIDHAERMAGVLLDSVTVGVGAGRLASQRFVAGAALERGVVTRGDIDRIFAAGHQYASRDGRQVVHLDGLRFLLDEHAIDGGLIGLQGRRLKAELHAITVDAATLQSLQAVIERCYLSPVFASSALASALAVVRPEEMADGCTVVDIGAGTVSLAMFRDGRCIAAGHLSVGGQLVSFDVQRHFRTPLAEAERIKTLYGSVLSAPSNELERVSFPVDVDGEMQAGSASRAEIRHVIAPRMDAMLAQIGDWRSSQSVPEADAGCVVLTGGGSQLLGLGHYAAERLGAPVRIGLPTAATGAQSNLRLAGYATALGLTSAVSAGYRIASDPGAPVVLGSRYLGRVGDWLRNSF